MRKVRTTHTSTNVHTPDPVIGDQVEVKYRTGAKKGGGVLCKYKNHYSIVTTRKDGWTICDYPKKKMKEYKAPDGSTFSSQAKARAYAESRGIRFDRVQRKKPVNAVRKKRRKKMKQVNMNSPFDLQSHRSKSSTSSTKTLNKFNTKKQCKSTI